MKTNKMVVRQPSAQRTRRKAVQGLGAARLAISFDPKLAREVQLAAKQSTRGNVSAWLAAAAADRLRNESLRAVVGLLEKKNGPSTKEDLEKLEIEWPRD